MTHRETKDRHHLPWEKWDELILNIYKSVIISTGFCGTDMQLLRVARTKDSTRSLYRAILRERSSDAEQEGMSY